MSDAPTIERRLDSLEREMADVRRRLDRSSASQNWLANVVGSEEDEPDFDEVLRLGREIRSTDRPSDDPQT